jgi:hypothetical protein
MKNKIKHFTYNQLVLLAVFLADPNHIFTINQLEQKSQLGGKSLGGVLSSLYRAKFRDISIIEPMGAARNENGLRWLLHKSISNVNGIADDVERLIKLYE